MGRCGNGIIRRLALGLALTCVTSGVATALPTAPGSDEGFGPHSLAGRSGAPADVCNFCHTPQGWQSTSPDWRSDQPEPEYQSYDARRSDGNIGMRGSVSVACLSCHDGSQAPDSAANTPYASASLGFQTMRGPTARDHPVGIVFSGYLPQETSGLALGNRLQRDVIGGEVRWWLDMEASPDGVRDKTDVIFYTQGTGAGAQPMIECGSCHDPHANPGNMFLRAATAGSNLCQACHNY